jgi:hypothetical protein
METQRFPRPKNFKTQTSWDENGVLLVDHLEKGENITAKYKVALLDELKQQLVSNL